MNETSPLQILFIGSGHCSSVRYNDLHLSLQKIDARSLLRYIGLRQNIDVDIVLAPLTRTHTSDAAWPAGSGRRRPWNAIDSSLFKNWLANMQSKSGILATGSMLLERVLIQDVDMFAKRIGFLKFKADVCDKESGQQVPGIVFARGAAVAVLVILESGDETFAVLTEQARVPVGKVILELPAGMLDDDKDNLLGTAVREVEEETGIHLSRANMVDLTAFLEPSTGCRVFPSPGGCDEEMSLFLYRGIVDGRVISELQGREMGLREHEAEAVQVDKMSDQKNKIRELCCFRNPYIDWGNNEAGSCAEQAELETHRSFMPVTGNSLGQDERLIYSYQHVMSGFTAKLTEEEAESLLGNNGVVSTHLDTMLDLHTTHTLPLIM
ncbi:unnamed protein product [Rhodiola kirilowii]